MRKNMKAHKVAANTSVKAFKCSEVARRCFGLIGIKFAWQLAELTEDKLRTRLENVGINRRTQNKVINEADLELKALGLKFSSHETQLKVPGS